MTLTHARNKARHSIAASAESVQRRLNATVPVASERLFFSDFKELGSG